jgi:hypothetical protein
MLAADALIEMTAERGQNGPSKEEQSLFSNGC